MDKSVSDSTKKRQRKSWSSAKILAVAVLLPVLTGFDYEKPQPDPVLVQEQAPPVTVAPREEHRSSNEGEEKFNWRRAQVGPPLLLAAANQDERAESAALKLGKVHSWETGENRSYLIPAFEIPGFLVALNIRNRFAYGDDPQNDDYNVTFSSIWHNIKEQHWTFDTDPFNVNQFGHPYQGAVMYGLARSTGLDFWESALYSNLGSFAWEMAGETDDPSINDMATTGTSGTLLGEALFRMASLVLREDGGKPSIWNEMAAAVISPPTALNRHAFGDRFKDIYPTNAPATFWRFRLGAALSGTPLQRGATADFAMSYGLPGKPGYTYKRPLDYFDFQISGLSRSGNPIGIVLLRGLLYGEPYRAGDNYRGIWGLYGSYDFISPGTFRVSNTALSLGTTAQYWVAPKIALQGSLLGGVGFGAAGDTRQTSVDRDYHYGVAPQTTLALRLLFWDRAVLETVGRGYIVSGTGSDDTQGSERILRATANLNIRIWQRHGLGFQYVRSVRNAHYGNLPSKRQTDGTWSLVYTFQGDQRFGAVEWRDAGDR